MGRYRFALIGGDLRSVKLAELLAGRGENVAAFGLEGKTSDAAYPSCASLTDALLRADVVIAPVPLSLDGETLNAPLHTGKIMLDSFTEAIAPGKLVIGGGIPAKVRDALTRRGAVPEDLLTRDDLAILNSVPTAEGAIQIAMEELPVTLRGLCTLVTGYGRVGKTLAGTLGRLGADVWVAVRNPRDAAAAFAEGLKVCNYNTVYDLLPGVKLWYNTVPARIITRPMLELLPEGALLIDVASVPGGVDREAAAESNKRVIHALSLPGKVAPLTAAENMLSVLYNIIREKEEEAIGHA